MSKRVSVLLQNSYTNVSSEREKIIRKKKYERFKTNIHCAYIHEYMSIISIKKIIDKYCCLFLILSFDKTKSKLFSRKYNSHEDLGESYKNASYISGYFFLSDLTFSHTTNPSYYRPTRKTVRTHKNKGPNSFTGFV